MLCMIFRVAAAMFLWLEVSRQASNNSTASEKIRRVGSVWISRQKAAIRQYMGSLPYKGALIASDSLRTHLVLLNFPHGLNFSLSLVIPDRSPKRRVHEHFPQQQRSSSTRTCRVDFRSPVENGERSPLRFLPQRCVHSFRFSA